MNMMISLGWEIPGRRPRAAFGAGSASHDSQLGRARNHFKSRYFSAARIEIRAAEPRIRAGRGVDRAVARPWAGRAPAWRWARTLACVTAFGYNSMLVLGVAFLFGRVAEGKSSTPRVGFTRVRKSSRKPSRPRSTMQGRVAAASPG